MVARLKSTCMSLLFAAMAASAACAAPTVTEEPRFTPEQIRADFDELYSRLQASHYDLFARRPQDEYEALFKKMRAEFDAPLSQAVLQVRFQRFVAYGNVAHANIAAPGAAWEAFRAGGGKAFPLILRVTDGKVIVIDDYSAMEGIALGDEVISIDGEPALRWLDRMRAHVSADNDYMGYTLLETRLPMVVWLELGEVEAFGLTVAKPGGRRIELTLPALNRASIETASARRPKHFELDWNTRESRLLAGGVAYLRPGPFYDNRPEATHPWDATAFKAFLDQAFAGFIEAGADRLLIDLRDNPGGDNSFSDPMVAWFATKPFRFSARFTIKVSEAAIESNRKRLESQAADDDLTSARLAAAYAGKAPGTHFDFPVPIVAPREGTRFTGRVFLLINRHSYSNTVLVAAIAQDLGFATILGEETADLASTYGAMESFTLSRTGITVGFPKAQILRPNDDPQARGVIPDIAIATPLAGSGDDVALQRAIEIASRADAD